MTRRAFFSRARRRRRKRRGVVRGKLGRAAPSRASDEPAKAKTGPEWKGRRDVVRKAARAPRRDEEAFSFSQLKQHPLSPFGKKI